MSIPKTTQAWTVSSFDSKGFETLTFNKETPLPEVSDYEVLVKFHAASLNYRDLIIPKGKLVWNMYLDMKLIHIGQYPFAQRAGVVPGSVRTPFSQYLV